MELLVTREVTASLIRADYAIGNKRGTDKGGNNHILANYRSNGLNCPGISYSG